MSSERPEVATKRSWRISDRRTGEEWDVEVTLDLERVINQVARAATYNRTGRATLFGGRIMARVVEHRPAGAPAPDPGRGRAGEELASVQ